MAGSSTADLQARERPGRSEPPAGEPAPSTSTSPSPRPTSRPSGPRDDAGALRVGAGACAELAGGGWGAWRAPRSARSSAAGRAARASARPAAASAGPPSCRSTRRSRMLAATYAKGAGKTVAFSLAAFRQAYAGGRDLPCDDNVVIAGAACEIHPACAADGVATRAVTRRAGPRDGASPVSAACGRCPRSGSPARCSTGTPRSSAWPPRAARRDRSGPNLLVPSTLQRAAPRGNKVRHRCPRSRCPACPTRWRRARS